MTQEQYDHLIRMAWWAIGFGLIASVLGVGNLVLKVVLYTRMAALQQESLDLLRLSREFQGMARQQKEHSSQVLCEVSQTAVETREAVKEIKQAVADSNGPSDSGNKLRVVQPANPLLPGEGVS